VSACFCVVLSCVPVEALRWTDPPTRESYQMSVYRKSIKEGHGPIRTVEASWEKKKKNFITNNERWMTINTYTESRGAVVAVTFRFPEVPGSNLGPKICYTHWGILWPSSVPQGEWCTSEQLTSRFLSRYPHFLVYCHFTFRRWVTNKLEKARSNEAKHNTCCCCCCFTNKHSFLY
jgi:hypothetical protein